LKFSKIFFFFRNFFPEGNKEFWWNIEEYIICWKWTP
jgi:hypothetical protein